MWSWLRRCWSYWRPWFPGQAKTLPLGAQGEAHAATYLQRLGWTIVARNQAQRLGELDLIALDGETVVFVEVKTRQGTEHGLPVEGLTTEQQRRICRGALTYLKHRGWLHRRVRFDVIGIVWQTPEPQLTHYRCAFDAPASLQMY
jgi:putative endonuclease